MSTSASLITLVLLLALNAWFVAAEFAMVSARRDQIEPDAVDGSTSAKYALRGIENVSVSLAATQLGITACSLLIGAVGEPAIAHFFEPFMVDLGLPASTSHVVALVLALLIVTFLHMVVGEMVPKNIAISMPSPTAKFVAIPLYFLVRILGPIIWAMNTTANFVVRKVFRATPKDEVDSSFTASQVQDFVAESGRQGLLDNDELALLHKALGFEHLTAADVIMKPATLVTVPADATVADIEQLAARTRFSRFPVVEGGARSNELANIIGYVHVKDLLSLDDDHRDHTFPQHMIRRFATVRSDAKLQEVMRLMQKEQAHFALVEDASATAAGAASGSAPAASGIVALEDVLEELVGEVRQATA
ncbi:MAG: hemolysin family protein [Corynebacterium sp.]|uniref:hemolysin family protein n=1 Tax=Corynebacterium sp. TaxID=1720 RepID=UPI0026DCAD60|nr:hemolysin family protein [Corynebacterium sp.]MDO5029014.1 hemolysin family protein [Corynebacterium sp.]